VKAVVCSLCLWLVSGVAAAGRIDFDGAEAALDAVEVTHQGAAVIGGRVMHDSIPGLQGSAGFHYRPSDNGAEVRFDPPVNHASFFFVHGFGIAPASATAYDASGSVVGTLTSRKATFFGDPANRVAFDSEAPIVRIHVTGGAVDALAWQTATDGYAVNEAISGSWVNSSHAPFLDGHGLLLELLSESNQLFVAWFTYAGDAAGGGVEQQRWLTAQGGVDGSSAELQLFSTFGGRFDAPSAVTHTVVGTMTVEFASCDRATVRYNRTDLPKSGTFEITRARRLLSPGFSCE